MAARLLSIGVLGLAVVAGPCVPVERQALEPAGRPAVAAAASPAPAPAPGDFSTQVLPILNARCQPCHFAGGKMYERLPFDRPQTIRSLGEKMFTRIKDERERAVLRAFLAQKP